MSGKVKIGISSPPVPNDKLQVVKGQAGILLGQGAVITSQRFATKCPVIVNGMYNVAKTADDAANQWWFTGSSNYLIAHNIDEQTVCEPKATSAGLVFEGDRVGSHGIELVACDGVYVEQLNDHNCFTVGTSSAFYLKARIKLQDVSEIATLYFGFRSVEAHQDTATAGYDDYIAHKVAAGTYSHAFEQDNSGSETVDAVSAGNMTDDTFIDYEIKVTAAGRAKLFVNGTELTNADHSITEFTLNSGDVVTPFLHMKRGGATTNPCKLTIASLEFGLESGR